MPLAIVERLVVKGEVVDGQIAIIHLHAPEFDYRVVCRVRQTGPPSHSLTLARNSPSWASVVFLEEFISDDPHPVIAQPIDIGGVLSVYLDSREVPLPGTIIGIELPE